MQARNRRPEMMDQPGLDRSLHVEALRGLGRINLWSRSLSALWRPIEQAARKSPIRVLDLACGGGDLVRGLASRAKKAGLDIQFDGADFSEDAIAYADEQAKAEGLNTGFFILDALRDPVPGDYDIVTCTLFLHHLDESDAVLLMTRMREASRKLVLIDDLIRSRFGYLLATVGCRLLSRSKVVHYDGPTSVSGAFRLDEVRLLAEKSGLVDAQITTHWPQRFLLSWNRT